MDNTFTEEQKKELWDFICEGKDSGSHYHGMSFEDGMEAVLEFIEGNREFNEIME